MTGAPDPALVRLAYAELARRAGAGDEPLVAVRSSATDEDGLRASFAGQHETILGVGGIDELLDPLCPARGDALVDAAFGLGESIVGGTITPDAFWLESRTLDVARRTIADKRRMTVRVPGGSREIDVPFALRRVTDTGGVLSHYAVVAREYGIPAVVGTQVATSAIADGDTIEVDGDAGIVRSI